MRAIIKTHDALNGRSGDSESYHVSADEWGYLVNADAANGVVLLDSNGNLVWAGFTPVAEGDVPAPIAGSRLFIDAVGGLLKLKDSASVVTTVSNLQTVDGLKIADFTAVVGRYYWVSGVSSTVDITPPTSPAPQDGDTFGVGCKDATNAVHVINMRGTDYANLLEDDSQTYVYDGTSSEWTIFSGSLTGY